jgi:flagellar hook-associated protein 3 FlgL
MRITFQSQYRDSGAAIERAGERFIEAQRQVSSGKRLAKISDDPTAAATSVAERSNIGQLDRYARTADSVAGRLGVVDSVLSDVVDKLTAARTIALSSQGSTKTAAEREVAVLNLRAVRDALLDNMNTKYLGSHLFGGAEVAAPPYSVPPAGTFATYAGDNNAMQVDVGDDRAVTIAFDGESITRGSDAKDLFESLDELITAVGAGDNDGIATGIAALQRVFERATAAQSRVGNDMQLIGAQKVRLQQMKHAGAERLAALEDLNMAEAITEMTHADAAYRASLGAVGTVSRVSLLDYLK